MKRKNQKNFCVTMCWFLIFIAWTVVITRVDLRGIGPKDSMVGFALLNGFFHKLTGVHMLLYTITDWLGLVPLCFVLGFAVLGMGQLIKRRSLFKVDSDILVLGGFYILLMASYVFFEVVAINYRPVLINGYLEISYPSSTTLLTMCVMPTTILQFNNRIKSKVLKNVFVFINCAFTIFMVGGRLICGVHWFTDIVGGVFLSVALVMLYHTVNSYINSKVKCKEII